MTMAGRGVRDDALHVDRRQRQRAGEAAELVVDEQAR